MKNLLPWLLMVVFFFSACSKENNDKDIKYKGHIKSRKSFIAFLLDLHRTDGVMITANLDDYNLDDHARKSYYNYLLRKHNLNYMDFRRSLDFYMEDLDKLLDMYNVITDSLKNQMVVLDSLQRKKMSKPNLWPGKQVYLIPFQDNSEDSIPFVINSPQPGVYELSANITVFPDDQTMNLGMKMIVHYADGTGDTATTGIYFKDGQQHKYILKLLVKDKPRPVKLYGSLLSYKKTLYMHIRVNNIYLIRYTKEEMPWYTPQERSVFRPD